MAVPELQSVLLLTAGSSDDERRVFPWGVAVSPIGIGSKGQWWVQAPGVLSVHLYVVFDGRQLQVTAASEGGKVLLNGKEIDQKWWPVPIPSELRFGGATIAVSCEETPRDVMGPRTEPPTRPAYGVPPGQMGVFGTLVVQPPQRAPLPPVADPHERKSDGPRVSPAPYVPVKQRVPPRAPMPVVIAPAEPARSPSTPPGRDPLEQTLRVPEMAEQPAAVEPARKAVAPLPIAFAGEPPRRPSEPAPKAAEPARRASEPAPRGADLPRSPSGPPAAAPDPRRSPSDPPAAVRVPPPIAGQASLSGPPTLSTVADGGALRDHAYRVAALPPEAAEAALREYAAAARRFRESPKVAKPVAASVDQRPGAARSPGPVAAPPTPPPPPPPGEDAITPPPAQGSAFARAWKETSTVKKLILALLPFAAAGTLLEKDPEPPTVQVVSQHPTAAASVSAVAAAQPVPKAMTSAAALPSSTPPQPAANGATLRVAAPSGSASAPVASAPGPTVAFATAASAPVATPPMAPTASAAVQNVAPQPSAAVAPIAAIAPGPGTPEMLEHMALAAAFQGNLNRAAQLYGRLATEHPDSSLYALAARLTKEGIVRSP